jgi:hypothetical protein
VIDTNGVKLDKSQIAFANDILTGKFSNKEAREISLCFIPHHGLVFYNDSKPVAYASVCLICKAIDAHPKQEYFSFEEFHNLIQALELPINL